MESTKEPTILELAEGMTKELLNLEGVLDSRLNRVETKPEQGSGATEKPQSVVGEIINIMRWNLKKAEELHARIIYEVLDRIS